MRRFSSSVVPIAPVTWRSDAFPTMHAVDASDATSSRTTVSASAVVDGRRVEPKHAIFDVFRPSSGTRRKNSMSFGFDPGQPPSM